ncbi:MAG: nucleotide disphospho-sugar-binding domain-containing protein, partial [Acidobacteriota bacterium]
DLVLGLGQLFDDVDFEPPSNILVLDWAPQVEILQRADVAITHGGVATIGECARFGVPMLVYSTGFVEQDGNAARVAFHQLGVLGEASPKHGAIIDLDQKLSHVLNDSTFRRRLAALREPLLAAERSDLAVRRIESAEVLP